MTNSIHTAQLSLQDKRIVLSGGTTGIGRAIGALLGSYGAKLFICGRHQKEMDEALDLIRSVGGTADGVIADVSRKEDIATLFAAADKTLGGVDIVIANAGIMGDGLADLSDDEWRYTLETNLLGTMACAKEGAARKVKQIVLVGSVVADIRGKGSSVYTATKAGMQGFAESFRKEMGEKGTRVTLVEPGKTKSDMTRNSDEDQREQIDKHAMLRAEDIAVGVHYALTQPERCNVSLIRLQARLEGSDD